MNLFDSYLQDFIDDLGKLEQFFFPFTKRIYIVGGAVRDMYLGIKPKELDIEIYDITPQKFEEIALKLGAVGAGKSFFVYKWKYFDLSLPRVESKVAPAHRGFKVEICDDEKIASKRRDFTMNSLMLHIKSHTLLDFWGGIEDIEKKTIRHINKKSFQEDALRVLRGIQFASRFGFMIEKELLCVMQNMELQELSKTRIFWELEKLFNSSHPEIGLLLGYKIGIWRKLLGVQCSFEDIFIVAKRFLKMSPFVSAYLRKYLFLYVFVHEMGLNMKDVLEKLEAPKEYEKYLLSSPYKKLPVSDKELFQIAIDMPLKNWLGIAQEGLREKAEKFNIYEKVFDGGIKSKDVIQDGFCGKSIGMEIRRRKFEKIDEILAK